jgi:hypothetical protein
MALRYADTSKQGTCGLTDGEHYSWRLRRSWVSAAEHCGSWACSVVALRLLRVACVELAPARVGIGGVRSLRGGLVYWQCAVE